MLVAVIILNLTTRIIISIFRVFTVKLNTLTKIINICGILHVIKRQDPLFHHPPNTSIPLFGAFESGISDHIIACEYLTISFHHFSSFSSNFGHGDKVSGPFSFSIIIIVHLKSIEHKRSVTLKYGGSSKMLFQASVSFGLETCRQNEITHDITKNIIHTCVFQFSPAPFSAPDYVF